MNLKISFFPTNILQNIITTNLKNSNKQYLISKFCIAKFIYLTILIFRLTFLTFASKNKNYFWFIEQYDPSLNYLTKKFISNYMIGLCLAPLVCFILLLDFITYIKPNLYIWKLYRQLTLENGVNFWQLNDSLKISIKWKSPILNYFECQRKIHKLTNFYKVQFNSKLSYYPNICPKVRVKVYFISIIYLQITKITLIINLTYNIFFYFILLYNISQYHSGAMLYVAAIDLAIIVQAIFASFVLVNFHVYNLAVTLLTFALHLKHLNQLLFITLMQRQKKRTSWQIMHVIDVLRFFRQEHTKMASDIDRLNRQIVSTMSMFCISSNLLCNLYLVTALVWFDQNFESKVITFILIITEIVGMYINALPLTLVIETFYSSTKYHFLFQHFLNSKFAVEKVKLAYYYEFMSSKKNRRIAFSAGSLGNFSIESMFQVKITFVLN